MFCVYNMYLIISKFEAVSKYSLTWMVLVNKDINIIRKYRLTLKNKIQIYRYIVMDNNIFLVIIYFGYMSLHLWCLSTFPRSSS